MSADNQQERSLDPWYITGFFEGEGCFSVSIHPHPSSRFGWFIDPVVQTYQHVDSKVLLERIKSYFDCGAIRPKGPNSNVLTFSVESRRTIKEKMIPHFLKFPLQGSKSNDFDIFCKVLYGLEAKQHFTKEGFIELVQLAFTMNPHGKNRKYRLEEIVKEIKKSSETTRRTRS